MVKIRKKKKHMIRPKMTTFSESLVTTQESSGLMVKGNQSRPFFCGYSVQRTKPSFHNLGDLSVSKVRQITGFQLNDIEMAIRSGLFCAVNKKDANCPH